MIEVTRLDNSKILINTELIQFLQSTPDTVITFISKDKMMVKEPVKEISRKIFEYQRSVNSGTTSGHREYGEPIPPSAARSGFSEFDGGERTVHGPAQVMS